MKSVLAGAVCKGGSRFPCMKEYFSKAAFSSANRERQTVGVLCPQRAYVGDGTLNVHIRKLREKVEENPSSPAYIITEYGKGYMFRLAKEN